MSGYCECGCGQPAPIAIQTRSALGHIAGQPVRFIVGHSRRRNPPRYEVVECGYTSPCFVWNGAKDTRGYALAYRDGRRTSLHRLVWEDRYGPLPAGAEVHHLCGTKPCVRIEHLSRESSHREHMQKHAPKLTLEKAREIRASTESGPVLAQRYGVSRSEISLIRRGKHWREC